MSSPTFANKMFAILVEWHYIRTLGWRERIVYIGQRTIDVYNVSHADRKCRKGDSASRARPVSTGRPVCRSSSVAERGTGPSRRRTLRQQQLFPTTHEHKHTTCYIVVLDSRYGSRRVQITMPASFRSLVDKLTQGTIYPLTL